MLDSDLSLLYASSFGKVEQQLQSSLTDLRNGTSPEKVLTEHSRRVTNILLHAPTKTIRDQDDSDLIRKILGIS